MTPGTPTADIVRATAELVAAARSRDTKVFRERIQRASEEPLLHLGAALLLLANYPDADPDNTGAGLATAAELAIQALAATPKDGE